MSWHGWLATGIFVGIVTERTLCWLEVQCAAYIRRRRERRELDQFWSER